MKIYVDPYIDKEAGVLKNKKGIKNGAELEKMEAEYVGARIRQLIEEPLKGDFNFEHFCRIHGTIFQDIYDWAGVPRIVNKICWMYGRTVEGTSFQRRKY